jgi:metallo-beta-lactamase family protein
MHRTNSKFSRLSNFYVNLEAYHPEVTGSCFKLTARIPGDYGVDTIKTLAIDCGRFQERAYEKYNKAPAFDPRDLDFVLITHNHLDHTGNLPQLCQHGYNNPIYCTHITKDAMRIALDDDYAISMIDNADLSDSCNLASAQDYKMVKQLTKGVDLEKTFSPCENIEVTFFDNGHLLGAACILVQIFLDKSKKVQIPLLFTGDFAKENTFKVVKSLPRWVRKLTNLTVIQEATYGNKSSLDVEETFVDNLKKTIYDGKSALSTVFAQERCPQVTLKIGNEQKKGSIDPSIPVDLDGKLAMRYLGLYIKNSSSFKKEAKNFIPLNTKFINKTTRERVLNSAKQKIIVTTSGMCNFGPAILYIPRYLADPNANIFINGYMAEGTVGRRIVEAYENKEKSVYIFGEYVEIKAGVFQTREFSQHARSNEQLNFLKQFDHPPQTVLINHGSTEARLTYENLVKQELGIKDTYICDRGITFKIGPSGFIKKFESSSINPKISKSSRISA